MADLADDIAMALVRGVGAYLRATAPQELPPKLRRFRSYRPQGLAPHRKELLAALEDDALRARIGEWLTKERPSLPAQEAAALRVAVDREEGWEGSLEGLSKRSSTPRPKPTPDTTARLDSEREKTKKAREDARKVKEEAKAAIDAERANSRELRARVEELTRRVTEMERSAATSSTATGRTQERLEREARKAKAGLEKAALERSAAKDELKVARREATTLRREVAALKSELAATKKKRAPARKPAAPRKRKPLPVPKGRLEDAPETLEEWIRVPDVHVLIDGYNVAKAEGGFGSLTLEEQRDRLVQSANKLALKVGGRTIVVFDGSKVAPGLARRGRGRAEVEYSRPDEIADDHIIARARELPPVPVILVTNDKELQERGRALGATVATSNQLLALIR